MVIGNQPDSMNHMVEKLEERPPEEKDCLKPNIFASDGNDRCLQNIDVTSRIYLLSICLFIFDTRGCTRKSRGSILQAKRQL